MIFILMKGKYILKEKKDKPVVFRLLIYLIRLFYPEMEVVGMEKLPDEPCIIVGNHAQIHGPVACELYFPDWFYTWCAAPMMKLLEVPSYAYRDFWSQKPGYLRPLFKIASYLIAPLSVLIFNNARTVAVYRDSRIMRTFRETVSKLQNGNNIVIFPEQDKKHNNIVYEFQNGFVDIARFYYKRTGRELCFVPVYIAPGLKKMCFGDYIKFSADAQTDAERIRISGYLMDSITRIARNLPEHTVVPYRNISKRLYPKNTEEADYENTGC